jgi:hypothetical protein
MRRTAISPDDKRLTLRLSRELWQQVRLEAARREVSATRLINQWIEERLGELEGDELMPTLEQLEALRGRAAGWNGYDALPPDPRAITFAETWLVGLYQQVTGQGFPWLPPHVTSSAEGEVVFEWWNDPRKLTTYCTAEEANFVKVWGPDMVTQMVDGDASTPADKLQLWEWLTGQIRRQRFPSTI